MAFIEQNSSKLFDMIVFGALLVSIVISVFFYLANPKEYKWWEIPVTLIIVLGLISQNSAITISAAVLLIMQQTLLSKYIPILEQYGVKIGIIILTIGVLAPLVSGKIQLPDLSSFLITTVHTCATPLCEVTV